MALLLLVVHCCSCLARTCSHPGGMELLHLQESELLAVQHLNLDGLLRSEPLGLTSMRGRFFGS